MAQHHLLKSSTRDFGLIDIINMEEDDISNMLTCIKFGHSSKQECPACFSYTKHYKIRKRKQWKCKKCNRFFSLKSGTILDDSKLPLDKIFLAVYLFSSEQKGISASSLSRKIKVSYKSAWLLLHKFREAIIRTADTSPLGGKGKEVHVDGAHFGGKPRSGQFRNKAKPASIAEKVKLGKSQGARRSRISRANLERRKKNRRIPLVATEIIPGQGSIKTRVFLSRAEDERAAKLIAQHILPETLVRTDESPAYNTYSTRFIHETVEHSKEYSTVDGVNNNQAESFFSRCRRMEYGVTHRMEAKYMFDYLNEMQWRQDTRRMTEKERFVDLFTKLLTTNRSRYWRGYWQGNRRKNELLI